MEFYGVIKCINFTRAFNVLKVWTGYVLSCIFKKVILLGYPYSLSTEPTNKCNLKCRECPTGNQTSEREKGEMNYDLYLKVIDELKKYVFYQMIYFQGEPFLNKDIFRMIEYSTKNKVYSCISTNGHFLSNENNAKIITSGLKKIIIPIDGASQQVYEQYRRGGNLSKVIDGVKNLILQKKESKSKYPFITIQVLVLKINEHQLSLIKDMAKGWGVDKVEFKSAQIECFPDSFTPLNNRYSRYFKKEGCYDIKNKLKNRCYRIWSTIVVSWNGEVVPCCFDKKLEFSCGNILNHKIYYLWRKGKLKEFRQRILDNRKGIEICKNCIEGLNIKA